MELDVVSSVKSSRVFEFELVGVDERIRTSTRTSFFSPPAAANLPCKPETSIAKLVDTSQLR